MENQLPRKWTGLPPIRFAKYRTWINREKPGICGTYCGAVLVHDTILHRNKKRLSNELLLNGLKMVIDDFLPYRGTFFWDVAHGLRRILRNEPTLRVRTGIVTERIVPELLSRENPMPVIVGTTFLLNSKYKNHWLVVYSFGYNEDGKLFYRGYDNHGRYKAVVPASQTISCIWLETVERKDEKDERI